tara:strand:- start:162 stop:329 length:168 start_codon:yes stop_codon:yes gene_type:complete
MKKMTKKELENIELWDITFRTIDKKGKEKLWTTQDNVDHSQLCDGWETQDFKERK